MLTIPYRMLFPAIVIFASIGCYSINNNPFDVYAIMIAGLVGYALIRFGCEPGPLLLVNRSRWDVTVLPGRGHKAFTRGDLASVVEVH